MNRREQKAYLNTAGPTYEPKPPEEKLKFTFTLGLPGLREGAAFRHHFNRLRAWADLVKVIADVDKPAELNLKVDTESIACGHDIAEDNPYSGGINPDYFGAIKITDFGTRRSGDKNENDD